MTLKSRISDFQGRQGFHPTIGGVFVNPFYIARRGLADAIRLEAPRLHGRLLDVGCGSKPYASDFQVAEYVGLDIDTPRTRSLGTADSYYDGGHFPFDSASFDSVLCNQVLEHVFNPDEFLEEIRRVLKPGGLLLMTIPFVWDEHEQPYDYARYSTFGLKALLEKHGFVVERQCKITGNISVLFQLLNGYLYKLLPRSKRIHMVVCACVMAPISLIGVALGRLLPPSPDLFLDQLAVARRSP